MPVELNPEPHPSVRKRVLIEALAARFGGNAELTVHLARELAARADIEEVAVLTRDGSIVERALAGDAAVRCLVLPSHGRLELALRLAWLAGKLRGLLRREHFDALVSMSGVLPASVPVKTVCVLGNAAMYDSRAPADAMRRRAVRRAARRADHLVAPSRVMAALVRGSTGRPCDAVPLGVDHETFRPATSLGAEILCVADFYAHKRHDVLLEAWLALRPPRPRLRLVGDPGADRQAHERVLSLIRAHGAAETVTLDERVPHERMGEVYRRAAVFVLASEVESFCMPLAEAMACGVPCVVRGLASLRETGGAGAIYVEGNEAADWAAAIQRLLDDGGAALDARDAAIDAGARFSWQHFADAIAMRL